MRIYTDNDGKVYVNAITQTSDGKDVEGQLYFTQAGINASKIEFQAGSISENGVNGLTSEALLAILIHRTKVLDSRVECDENKRAIEYMELAMFNFDTRTAKRMVGGVEVV